MSDPLEESLAKAIHEDYLQRTRAQHNGQSDDPSLSSWDDLPETLRHSNRDQAADIVSKMKAIGCEVVPKGDTRRPVLEFTKEEVERLAKLEHDRWEAERRAGGWTFGATKDADAKRSPYLVPWEDLSEEVRDLDRDTVRGIPKFVSQVGLVVVRVPTNRT